MHSPSPRPTIRSLARKLSLAPATVSDALRGTGRVAAHTIRRVRQAAKESGYRANPLTSTVLSEVRRKWGSTLRGTIATIDLHEPVHWPHGPFPRELVAGVRRRAGEMGFRIVEFVVGSPELSMSRLDSILHSRGILGVIVLPSWREPDLSGLEWSRYTGIYMDYMTTRPALHSVCPDHYESMMSLLRLLVGRGYRRPGLLLERGRDARIGFRHSAAFRCFLDTNPGVEPVPVLFTPGIPRGGDFLPWYRRNRPDVVLSHLPETQAWIQAAGAGAADATGFVLLNMINRTQPCAGLDLQPRLLGARGAELVVGQILRNEVGLPEIASRSTLQARWSEGPTVRPPPAG